MRDPHPAGRGQNERALLSLLHREGEMPASVLARRLELSAQAVSVILRRLQAQGLVARGTPQAGKVGKPGVPMRLRGDGVLAFGVKIGRRSAQLVLMDLLGQVVKQAELPYAAPVPDAVFTFLGNEMADMIRQIGPDRAARICGIGVAMPSEPWRWSDPVHAGQFAAWEQVDIAARMARITDLPVHVANDATAACRGEQIFGVGRRFADHAYVYLGTFVGGGIVLDHRVFEGRGGNAGAFGSMPAGPDAQLIDRASLHVLETRIRDAGGDVAAWQAASDWSEWEAQVGPWIAETGTHLARVSLTACAVIDFEAVVFDGAMPGEVRDRLVTAIRARMAAMDSRGLTPPRIEPGTLGAPARAIGAACAPIEAQVLLPR